MSYIFGGDTGLTQEDLARRQKIVDAMARASVGHTPRNVGEGLHAIGRALIARKVGKDLSAARKKFAEQQAEIPKYRYGTSFHPGGPAIVGEEGPELVNLPRGAQVLPHEDTKREIAQALTDIPPMDSVYEWPPAPEADEYMLDEMGEEEFYKYKNMTPLEQQYYYYDPKNGFVPEGYTPPGWNGGFPEQQSMFDDANSYQVADSSGDLPYGDEKLTGDQSKSIAYYRRGFGANQVLNDPVKAKALTQFTDTFAGNFGGIGRVFQDADYQVARRAADEFLATILRKDTGAAITNEEFRLYGPMYLPMPGDKPELLAAKAKARKEALTAIEMGLGTAAPLADITRKELNKEPDLGTMSDEDLLKALQGGG